MRDRVNPPTGEGSTSVAVEVLRPHDGLTVTVRSLSDVFGGLFVHYQKGRSRYCHPTECYPSCKRQQRDWRGYCAVEQWCPKRKLWFPGVLEVTEYLHVELAERWNRWQVWEMYRPEKVGGKRAPTVPTLIRQDDGNGYPRAFPILPVLKRLLGAGIRDLDEKNPMPPRLYMAPSSAPPPKEEEKKADPAAVQAMMKRFREQGLMTNGTGKKEGPEES